MSVDALTGTKGIDSKIVNEGNRTVLLFCEKNSAAEHCQ